MRISSAICLMILLMFAGVFVTVSGAWMNQKAMRDNGGKMPVLCLNQWMEQTVSDDRHSALTPSSNDFLLDDIILVVVADHGIGLAMMSFGDGLIGLGMALYAFSPFIVFLICVLQYVRKKLR